MEDNLICSLLFFHSFILYSFIHSFNHSFITPFSFGIGRESTTSYMEYVKQFVNESNIKLSDAAIQAIQASWVHVKTVGFQFFGHLLFSFWLG